MGYFAYHRVSTKNQNLDRGIQEIEKFCNDRGITLDASIFLDKCSGKTFDRPRYVVLKEDVLRTGDSLIITEMDRLGRNKREILKELEFFRDKGVRVMILEIPTTLMEFKDDNPFYNLLFESIQNMLIELFSCFAEAELEKKNKRQREGIDAMKKRGDWDKYGRPHVCEKNDFLRVFEKVENGMTVKDAAKELNMSVASFYRYRDKFLSKAV